MTTLSPRRHHKSCGESHGKKRLKRKALRRPQNRHKGCGLRTWHVGSRLFHISLMFSITLQTLDAVR